MKKKQQYKGIFNKRKTKRSARTKRNARPASPEILTKNFEIFVTDFLTDPCGLPVELRDCVLVDDKTSFNDGTDLCLSPNSQVLKKIFNNNESIGRMIKTSTSTIHEDSTKLINEGDQRIHV